MSSRVSTLGSWNYYSVPLSFSVLRFAFPPPLPPLGERGLVVVRRRSRLHPLLELTTTTYNISLSLSLFSFSTEAHLHTPNPLALTPSRATPSSTRTESINQRSSGAPCYRHDERWKYRAHARDITEAGLGYVFASPRVRACLTAVTTFVTPCLSRRGPHPLRPRIENKIPDPVLQFHALVITRERMSSSATGPF